MCWSFVPQYANEEAADFANEIQACDLVDIVVPCPLDYIDCSGWGAAMSKATRRGD